jgi:hypothetical protein
MRDGKRHQRTEIYDSAQYQSEKDLRKAIELTVSQLNAGTTEERADAKFGAITALYRTEHLPTLDHSTDSKNTGLLDNYIDPRFGKTALRAMRPLVINEWLQALALSQSSKAAIR